MSIMQMKPAPRRDWNTFYSDANLDRLRVPAYSFSDPEDAVFRHPVLVWSKVKKELEAASSPSLIMLICDVLILDEDMTLDLTGFIFARRIEVKPGVALTVDRAQDPEVELYLVVQDIVEAGSDKATILPFANVYLDKDGEEDVREEDVLAIYSRIPAWGLQLTKDITKLNAYRPCDIVADFLKPGYELRAHLDTQFILASLIFDSDDKYALPMLEWIAALGAENEDVLDLAVDAHSLHGTLMDLKAGREQNALVVPALDHTIYEEDAKAWATLLNDREQRLHDLEKIEADDENWSDQVELLMNDKRNDLDLTQKLLAQAENTRNQMREARQMAATQVQQSQAALIPISSRFELGVKAWKRKAEASEAVSLLVNSAQLLMEIPTIVTLAPQAAAMPAAQAASSVIDFVATEAKTAYDYHTFVAKERTRKKRAARLKAKKINRFEDDDEDYEDRLSLSPQNQRRLSLSFDGDDFDDAMSVSELQDSSQVSPLNSGVIKLPESDEKLEAKAKEMKAKQKELVASGKAVGKSGMAIVKNVMNLIKIAANARNLEKTSDDLLARVAKGNKEGLQSIDPIGIDAATGGKQIYDLLEQDIKELIRKCNRDLFLSIDGGAEFEQEILRMIVLGKAMCMARLALAKSNSDLAAAKLHQQSAERAVKLFQNRKDELDAKVLNDAAFKQAAFRQTIELRRSVFLALEAYQRAIKYYTLMPDKELPKLPRITDSVFEFNKAANAIAGRKLVAGALNSLYRGFGTETAVIRIDDPVTLENLRTSAGDLVSLPKLDRAADVFHRYVRIRLEELEIRLEGLESDETIEVNLLSDGFFADKDTDRSDPYSGAQFIAKPLVRLFKYKTDQDAPVARTRLPDRIAHDFFKPTPFSQWRISVTDERNNPLDLENVTAIEIKLHVNTAL